MKSQVASLDIDTIPIPFDSPHTVTIVALGAKKLGKVKKAFFNEIFDDIFARGKEKQKELEAFFTKIPDEKGDKAAADVAEVKADPLNGHDPYSLIFYGLKAWTYDEPIPEPADAEARRAFVDDLKPAFVDFCARAILKHTDPSLFHDTEEAKAVQKETHADSSAS